MSMVHLGHHLTSEHWLEMKMKIYFKNPELDMLESKSGAFELKVFAHKMATRY